VPTGGSFSTDVGTSLSRLGAVVALSALGVLVIVIGVRWLTGDLQRSRSARRRKAATTPPVGDPQGPQTAAQRRAAACGHPAGRRTTVALPSRPRRPLQLVAADLRRLTRELAMVPGGLPMARRRGLLAAYDDVLVEAAELLEVPHTLTGLPASGRELERMRLLATLEAAGLAVSD